MSLWSTLKSKISSVYKRADSSVGGYLPGGVSPSSSSSGSTSTSSSGGSVSTSMPPASYQGGTTIINSAPTSSGGGSSSGGSVSTSMPPASYQGGTTIINSAPQEDKTLLGSKKTINSQTINNNAPPKKTSSLTSSNPATVSALEYTGQPPEIYKKSLGSSLKQSLGNVFNFGVIGQQGLGAYSKQAFFEPFKNFGTPQAYSQVGFNFAPNWRGTEFGFGMSEDQKQIYTPSNYQDTTNKTYFDISEEQKRQLYNRAGLSYSGQPASLIPFRLEENIIKNLTPKYQEEYNKGVQDIYKVYQGRVSSGELTVAQAQTQFEAAAGYYGTEINKRFETEFSSNYASRYGSVKNDITRVESFNQKIFEPPAYPVIRGIGKGIEAGGIIGASAFGGSGLTFAASTYLGYKTASQTVNYAGSYGQLTKGQKITGAASIGLGALATAYTFNLGTLKFYSEWRGIIYSDLASSRATVTGREALKTPELTQYNIASLRRSGTNTAFTKQKVDVYSTGEDNIGFFSKGSTRTRIYDPQYHKYISTTESFKLSGNIPNIQQGDISSFRGKSGMIIPDSYYGVGRVVYSSDKNLKSFSFVSSARDQGDYFGVIGGSSPQRAFDFSRGGNRITSTSVRSSLDSTGKIYKMTPIETGSSGMIISSGSKSSPGFLQNMFKPATSLSLGSASQKISIGNIAKGSALTGSGAAGSGAVTLLRNQKLPAQVQSPQKRNVAINSQIPVVSSLGVSSNRSASKGAAVLGSSSVIISSLGLGQRQPAILSQSQAIRLNQVQSLRLGSRSLSPLTQINPGSFNPNIYPSQRIPPFLWFNLDPGGLDLGSNIVRGGQKVVSYTPSFSALAFNIKGSAPRSTETGINFRPITPGFKFNTGLSFKGFRRFLRI